MEMIYARCYMGIGIDRQRHQRGNGLLHPLKCSNIFGVQSLDVLSVDSATATMLLGQPTLMEMDCKVEEVEFDGWMDSWIGIYTHLIVME
jgi:hypothetical protein